MKLYVNSLTVFVFMFPCHGFDFPTTRQISNEKIKNFIEDHMSQDIIILLDNIAGYDWLLRQEFSKTILTHSLKGYLHLQSNSSYILVIKNLESLDNSIEILEKTNWNTRRPHLIIYTDSPTEQNVKQTLSKLFRRHVYNTAVYLGDTFYTWYPYDKRSECAEKVNLKKIDKNDPFLDKIPKKLHGCRINITWNYMSIMLENPFDKRNPGALATFLANIAKAMNVRFYYLRNNTQFYWAYLHNNSFSELVADMNARNIDMVVYMVYNGFASKSLENSARIYQANTYVLLPARRKFTQKNYAINLYRPSLAACLLTLLAVLTGAWKIVSKRSAAASIFDVLQLAVQGGLSRVPTAVPARSFLPFLLLFFLCLNAVYYTQLSSVLTKPSFVPKIRTLRTLLLHTDIKIMSYYATIRHLKMEETLTAAFVKKLIPMNGTAEEALRAVARSNSKAVTCIEFHLNYFKNREQLEVMYEEPMNPVVYLAAMKRGHHLLRNMDFWIDNIKERGLMGKYVRDFAAGLNKMTAPTAAHLEKVKLELVHVEGAFVILCVGVLVSGMVFALEVRRGGNRRARI